jgi:hypothetical protein
MATSSTFSAMLKRYMPTNLLVEEMRKRNFFFRKVKKDMSWMGGRYEVPFEGAEASSIKVGSLASSSDISETNAVLGYEDQYREIWGSMIFNEKDLDLNNDFKGSFLKILPGKLNQFLTRMERDFSHSILLGPVIDTLAADGTAGGNAEVNFPERFSIGQKCQIRNSTPTAADVYVIAINMETKIVQVSASRGGAALNISAYTTALSSALYLDGSVNTGTGAIQNNFNSLENALLSAANGGDASIHNQTKATYPFLQAHNVDGSGMTEATVLEDVYDAFMDVERIGKGRPSEILCSYKNFGSIVKDLETNRRFAKGDSEAGFGFRSIEVLGPGSQMKVTALREMDDDLIFIIDWNAIILAGSNFFNRKRHGNNEEFFMIRATTGYQYVVDVRLYGNLIVQNPSYCGVIHTISY